nr:MAG TPA_asm: glycosyltransferase [Caudoviricetes sp.]
MTAQYFAVAQPRTAVLVVDADDVIHPVQITAAYYFSVFTHLFAFKMEITK